AGREGRAISFATGDQRNDIRNIERIIRSSLRRTPTPLLPKHIPVPEHRSPDHDRHRPSRPPFRNARSPRSFGRNRGNRR
ncbi:MAG: hypothetical protein PHO54_01530, partial [Candidatus Peribacteraceae bacterium]|nr:hypothetical protein [Candidatus Peribacteraceae bacterium]